MDKIEFNPSIPITFENVVNVLDDGFMRVKIWIAHTGENRNNCIFSKEVLESMIPTLANKPILGYVADNKDGEVDFKAHEERLVIEEKKFKLKYFGHAYGLIPADNNARFESRFGEDGLEREYLVCDGLLWIGKFPEIAEIFERDGGYKSQSMELQHSSVKGYTNEDGVFVFTSARFEGACLLGEDVSPAMISSTVERFSVADKIQEELKEMLAEFNTHFSTTKEKGDDKVPEDENLETTVSTEFAKAKDKKKEDEDKDKKVEPKKDESKTDDSKKVEPKKDESKKDEAKTSDKTDDSKEDKLPPFLKDKDEKDESKKEDKTSEKKDEEDEEDKKKKKPSKFSRTFELSHDDIRSNLYNALDTHESFKDSFYYVSKVFDNHAIVSAEEQGKFFKVNYVKHESAVSIGEMEELFPLFVNSTEKQAIDSSRNNFAELEQEVSTLREFKDGIELAEKEQKLTQYSTTLTEEEYKSIKENLSKFSINDIEKEIGFMLLKKNHFSAKTDEETTQGQTRVATSNTTVSNPYGSASVYFSK